MNCIVCISHKITICLQQFPTNDFSVRERLSIHVSYSYDYNVQYIVKLFYIGKSQTVRVHLRHPPARPE